MDVKAYSAGYCLNNGKPSQQAGCAALLQAQEGQQYKCRRLGMPLGGLTGNQAELQGALLALAAIRPGHRKESVSLYAGSYVIKMLERSGDDYAAEPTRNARAVARLRELVRLFPHLVLLPEKTAELRLAQQLAKHTANTQRALDSGTHDGTIVEGCDEQVLEGSGVADSGVGLASHTVLPAD